MRGAQFLCVILFGLVALKPVDSAMSLEQMMKAANGVRNNCITKTGVDPALAEGLRRGEFPDDPDLKCYTNCVMKVVRTFKNGAIDMNMMIKQVEAMMPAERQDRVKAGIRACVPKAVGDDPCTLTYSYVKCNYEFDPEIFFFP